MPKHIVFFDGQCVYCNKWVRRIFKWNKTRNIFFAALEDEKSVNILKQHGHNVEAMSSVIFLSNNQVYSKSSAVLQICKHLDGLWKFASVFIIIPRPIRDYLYNVVGRNRYKWFGTYDECPIPEPDLKKQFVL